MSEKLKSEDISPEMFVAVFQMLGMTPEMIVEGGLVSFRMEFEDGGSVEFRPADFIVSGELH